MEPKILYLGTIKQKFEEAIVIFEITNFEFTKMISFMLKEKELNWGPKMLYFCIFELEFEKNYCHIRNDTFEFVKMDSFMFKVQSCKLKKH